ncbi:hypothetical protein JCGZ_05328 [Jatropha curcas]|uniref:Uncharacterized protein n=1 Tax=Jatropha curcas TaxID=180498 RepID=A0A067KWT0_JATCU|nr:hypothetical protein JCGZ_05328 [Jatropha curcas]
MSGEEATVAGSGGRGAGLRHGHITVPGTRTVGSNRSGTVTETGENRNRDEPEPKPEKSSSVPVPANEEPEPAVPENRSEPD